MKTENDEDDKLTRGEILGKALEYGLYAAFAVAIGLLAKMFIQAF